MNTEMSITDRMRDTLRPQGTLPVVQLRFGTNNNFFEEAFVKECIDELDKVVARAHLGERPNPLEKLAYILLCDSANIESFAWQRRRSDANG